MSGAETFEVDVQDWRLAAETAQRCRAGSWFVFAEGVAPGGRLERLLARPAKARTVHAISGSAIELPGLRLGAEAPGAGPNRLPGRGPRPLPGRPGHREPLLRGARPGRRVRQVRPVHRAVQNGAPVSRRDLDLGKDGTAVEAFASLMAGRYEAKSCAAARRSARRPRSPWPNTPWPR